MDFLKASNSIGHRVTVAHFALSDHTGEADFHVSSGSPIPHSNTWNYGNKSSSLIAPNKDAVHKYWPWLHFKQKIKVKTETIDN